MTTTSSTYLDEFMDKMYLVPNDINRYLRLIRSLDRRAQAVQQSLNQMQGKFLNQIKQFKQTGHGVVNGSTTSTSKKQQNGLSSNQIPSNLRAQYQKILTKQKQLYGYYKEKNEVAQQLRYMVIQIYEQLDNQLKNKLTQKTQEQKQSFMNRKKYGSKYYQQLGLSSSVTGGSGTVSGPSNLGGKIGASGTTGANGYLTGSSNFNGQFMYDNKEPTYCYCGRASFGQMVMCQSPYCQREWFHTDCIEQKNLPQKWYCLECQKQKQKTRNPHSRSFFVNRES